MSKVYVISDLHFGHENMAKNRGFKDSAEHDAYIINQWNKVILKKDVVYILGDITMEKSGPYVLLDKLNGIKKVILGNHDMPQHVPELLKHVNSVCGMKSYNGIMLSHCPIHEQELAHWRMNIHGHVHLQTLWNPKYVNVSCEAIGYEPMLLPLI